MITCDCTGTGAGVMTWTDWAIAGAAPAIKPITGTAKWIRRNNIGEPPSIEPFGCPRDWQRMRRQWGCNACPA
jgi:hypothetical protein